MRQGGTGPPGVVVVVVVGIRDPRVGVVGIPWLSRLGIVVVNESGVSTSGESGVDMRGNVGMVGKILAPVG